MINLHHFFARMTARGGDAVHADAPKVRYRKWRQKHVGLTFVTLGLITAMLSMGAPAALAAAAPTITSLSPTSGSSTGGTVVVVTGTGFTGATGVTFGGAFATGFSVVTDTQITVTSPAHAAGAVDVVVSSPDGNSAPQSFTYGALPIVASLAPSFGTSAGGTTVTVTGTGFTGATGVTFGGSSGSAFTVDSDTQITVTSPAHAAGAVDVVVSGPGGNSAPKSFTYVASPVVSSLAPSSGTSAGGTTVTVTGTGFTGATGVTFGGSSGSAFTVDSDTQITVTSPAHAVSAVDVIVHSPSGSSLAATFTYIAPMVTVIDAVTPHSGAAAGGTAVTITGHCFTAATDVVFGTHGAAGFTVVSDTTITATTPAGQGTVDVTVKGSATCGNSTDPDGFTYLASVAVLPFTGASTLLPAGMTALALLLAGLVLATTRRRRPQV